MARFRKNQEVQNFLKDQMAHVERQREINLVKKQEEAEDVKMKVTEFQKMMKNKAASKRQAITTTQAHNKMEMTARGNFFRNNADSDRRQSMEAAAAQVQKAAYLEQLEKEEAVKKKHKHRKELE